MRVSLFFLCVSLSALQLSLCIRLPGEKVDKNTLTTLGIKTLGWQDEDEVSDPQVHVHHNYSKVSVQNGITSVSHYSQSQTGSSRSTHSSHSSSSGSTSGTNQGFYQSQTNGQTLVDEDDYLDLDQVQVSGNQAGTSHQSTHSSGNQQGSSSSQSFTGQEEDDDPLELVDQTVFGSQPSASTSQSTVNYQKQNWGTPATGNQFVDQNQQQQTSFTGQEDDWSQNQQQNVFSTQEEQDQFDAQSSKITNQNNQEIYDAHGYGNMLELDQVMETESELKGQQVYEDYEDYQVGQLNFGNQNGEASTNLDQQERRPKNFYTLDKPIYIHGYKYPPDQEDVYPANKPKPQAQPEIYSKCPKMATGQFVHAESCNQFLNCWKGRGFVQNCAPGTLFNPKTLECDFASKVQCLTGPRKLQFDEDEQRSNQKLVISCPAEFSGVVPHHTDCSKFINCANGVEYVMDCPPGTLFSLKINNCDHPYKAECASWSVQYGNIKNYGQSAATNYHGGDNYYQQQGQNTYDNKYGSTDEFRLHQGSGYLNQNQGYGSQHQGSLGGGGYGSSQTHQASNQQGSYGSQQGGYGYQQTTHKTNVQSGQVGQNQNQGQAHHGQHQESSWSNNQQLQGTHVQTGQGLEGKYLQESQNGYGQSQYNQGQYVQGGQNQQGQGHYIHGSQNYYGQTQNQGQYVHGGQTVQGQGQNQEQTYHGQHQQSASDNSQHVHNEGSYDHKQDLEGQYLQGSQNVYDHQGGESQQGQGQYIHGSQNLYGQTQTQGKYTHGGVEQTQGYGGQNKPLVSGQYASSPPKCPQGSQGLHPHPSDCSKFLECTHGQTAVKDCGAGTLFNPESKICDFPYNVKCFIEQNGQTHSQLVSQENQRQAGLNIDAQKTHGYGVGTQSQTSSSIYEGIFGDVKDVAPRGDESPKCPQHASGLYPHPTICSKFLNCANGQTFIQDCGPGTVFHPLNKVCDFPYNVECGVTHGEGLINIRMYPAKVNQGHSQGGSEEDLYDQNIKVNKNQEDLYGGGQQGGSQQQASGGNQHEGGPYGSSSTNSGRYDHDQAGQGQAQASYGYGQSKHQGSSGYGQTGTSTSGFYGQGSSTNTNQQELYGQSQNKHHGSYDQGQIGQSTGTHPQQQASSGYGQTGTSTSGFYGQGSSTSTDQQGFYEQNQNKHQGSSGYGQTTSGQGPKFGVNQQQGFYGHTQTNQQGFEGQNQNTGTNKLHGSYGQGQIGLSTGGHQQQQQGSYGHSKTSWTSNQQGQAGEDQELQATNQQGQFLQVFGQGSSKPHHSPAPFPSTDINADYEFGSDGAGLEVLPLAAPKPKGSKFQFVDRKRKDFCEAQDFHCSVDDCLPQSMVCDGVKDCPDGSDEFRCENIVNAFALTPNTILAVREKERFLNISVVYCAKSCLEAKGFQCKSFSYRKSDGVCFLSDTNVGHSGALIISHPYSYYELTSHTVDCINLYKCPSQKCIKFKQVCDGVNDCGDRTDEKGCSAKAFGYEVRLGGSDKKYEGRIELKAFGRWGYVCDDKFGLRDADVACRELGFPLGSLEVKSNSYYAQDLDEKDVFYLMDDVSCLGNETTLRDCDFNGWGVSNCEAQEVVGVVCKTPLETCPKDHWKCDSGQECIPLAFLCEGVYDCTDQSDERDKHCEAPVELRLADGSTKAEGRLEIRYHGIWGTVCDDDFNDDSAKVVCKSLGYPGKASSKKDGYFGAGQGPIWLDQVFCQGNESSIEHCVHWNWGEHNCEHGEDVGVICSSSLIDDIVEVQRNVKLESKHNLEDVLPQHLFPERCGLRKDDQFVDNDEVHFRVVKGLLANKGDYPWQASLRIKNKAKSSHWCGAVVIDQKFVLTAAHCLSGFSKGAYFIVAGDYNTDEEEGTEQEAYIEEFYIHEQFRVGQKMNNDVALVKLKGSGLTFTKDVQPICLPDADLDYEQGLNCTISGFGTIESGKAGYSHQLRAGWVPMQSRAVCQMPHVYGSSITDGMICAGTLDEGVDSCEGDSGGPLACLHDGFFTLYGITSWGHHCGHANKPGVYVKVSHYRKWIEETIKKNS